MKNVVSAGSGGAELRTTAIGFICRYLSATQPDGARSIGSSATLLVLGVIYICLVGWVNLLIPHGLDLQFLYLLGCALVGWNVGTRPALGIALLSWIFLIRDDVRTGQNAAAQTWIFYGNAAIRLLVFMGTGWLASVGGQLALQLKREVNRYTASLQSEVEERNQTAMRWKETAQLFRQLTENITEAFWVSEPGRTRINYLSPGYERIWGQPCRTVYTEPGAWLGAVHQADREQVKRAIGEPTGNCDVEYRVIRPDGTCRWVHDRTFPVRDETQKIYRAVSITEDITERKREEQLRQVQRDFSYASSVTSDLSRVLEQLLGSLVEIDGIDCGGVYLVERTGGELKLEAHHGLSREFSERALHVDGPPTETHLIHQWRTLQLTPRPDAVQQPMESFRALAVIPLRHQEEVLGALCLASRGQAELPRQTVAGLETIAGQAAAVIARIRTEESLQRQILEISDREQARIGQDIHDGLCQQIVGAAFVANSLEQSLATQGRPESAHAARMCLLLDEAFTESRRVTRGLYPVRLRTEGLAPALAELATTASARFGVSCSFQAGPEGVHCETTTATHLYRIAQEAVNNAIKHSGASNIVIHLNAAEGVLQLEVRDNGKGIPDLRQRKSGMGLHIMDYRARSIGAELSIRGSAQGTSVSCRLPKEAGSDSTDATVPGGEIDP
jgi:PAS domain S-box-containing protein